MIFFMIRYRKNLNPLGSQDVPSEGIIAISGGNGALGLARTLEAFRLEALGSNVGGP